MKFLTVLIIVFLYRHRVGENPLRALLPFGAWVSGAGQRIESPIARYLLFVAVPVMVVWLVATTVHGWLFGLVWLALSLAVLVYAVDIDETGSLFDEQARWLQEFSLDSRSEGNGAGNDLAAAQARQDEFRLATIYGVFQGLYPALFWYLLLGPAGALFYGLTRQYQVAHHDNTRQTLGGQVLYWLEWPAARVTGLIFALLGHFGHCFDEWLRSLPDVHEQMDSLLVRLANAATTNGSATVDMTLFASHSVESNLELRLLLDRTLFGWLAIAAIITILGF